MLIKEQTVVGDVVASNYKTAEIFKKYGLDFCCGGSRSIQESCEHEGLPPRKQDQLLYELNNLVETQGAAKDADYIHWPLDLVIDHVEKLHHRNVEKKVPVLKAYLNKIETVHGKQHPELTTVNTIFQNASDELIKHMKKEEIILFPYIRKMVTAQLQGQSLTPPPFGTIKNPIAQMDEEHVFEGDAFAEISKLTDDYTPPSDACTTYKVTFLMLKEFEEDLHLHIHIENNILFKKAIALEENLLA